MRRTCKITADTGNALVLAVLILLALTSVGIVSIQRTNMDLLVAGNVVQSFQAQMAGEAGADHGLGQVGAMPDRSARQLKRNRDLALGHTGITQTAGDNPNLTLTAEQFAFSSAVPDPSGADIGQHLPVISGANPVARSRQDVAYRLGITYLYRSENQPGWSSGEVCYYGYDFNALGGVPSTLEPVNTTLPPATVLCPPTYSDTVVVQTRARAMAGPVPCK
jgi:hypothetical protein